MIDFQNASFVKLKQVPVQNFEALITPILIDGESIMDAFQGIRDSVVFTNKRVIAMNVQGITGKKKDLTSLPYSKVQAFSVETAGMFDLDSELELWFSGIGKVCFEISGKADIAAVCKMIGSFILK